MCGAVCSCCVCLACSDVDCIAQGYFAAAAELMVLLASRGKMWQRRRCGNAGYARNDLFMRLRSSSLLELLLTFAALSKDRRRLQGHAQVAGLRG